MVHTNPFNKTCTVPQRSIYTSYCASHNIGPPRLNPYENTHWLEGSTAKKIKKNIFKETAVKSRCPLSFINTASEESLPFSNSFRKVKEKSLPHKEIFVDGRGKTPWGKEQVEMLLLSVSSCLWPAVPPLNKWLYCLESADVCHSTVLAVRIRAARLIKGYADASGAAPMAGEPEIHKQTNIQQVQ